MAEPSSTTFAVAAGVGLAGLIPGVDGNALLGAFTGAALVVVTAKDLSVSKRFAYLGISLVAGYLAAPEVLLLTPIRSSGIAAFFAAALAITVTLQAIDRVKAFELAGLFKKGGRDV